MSNLLRARVAFQGAALCRVYSRHHSLRDLADKVSQKFPKKLEIVGLSDNSPKYLAMSCEWQRNGDQIDNAFVFTRTYLVSAFFA